MIEGTKPYKKLHSRDSSTNAEPLAKEISPAPATAAAKEDTNARHVETVRDAANPARRELFAQIIPGLGAGLVKLLRASNNLKADLENHLQKENRT